MGEAPESVAAGEAASVAGVTPPAAAGGGGAAAAAPSGGPPVVASDSALVASTCVAPAAAAAAVGGSTGTGADLRSTNAPVTAQPCCHWIPPPCCPGSRPADPPGAAIQQTPIFSLDTLPTATVTSTPRNRCNGRPSACPSSCGDPINWNICGLYCYSCLILFVVLLGIGMTAFATYNSVQLHQEVDVLVLAARNLTLGVESAGEVLRANADFGGALNAYVAVFAALAALGGFGTLMASNAQLREQQREQRVVRFFQLLEIYEKAVTEVRYTDYIGRQAIRHGARDFLLTTDTVSSSDETLSGPEACRYRVLVIRILYGAFNRGWYLHITHLVLLAIEILKYADTLSDEAERTRLLYLFRASLSVPEIQLLFYNSFSSLSDVTTRTMYLRHKLFANYKRNFPQRDWKLFLKDATVQKGYADGWNDGELITRTIEGSTVSRYHAPHLIRLLHACVGQPQSDETVWALCESINSLDEYCGSPIDTCVMFATSTGMEDLETVILDPGALYQRRTKRAAVTVLSTFVENDELAWRPLWDKIRRARCVMDDKVIQQIISETRVDLANSDDSVALASSDDS